MAFKTIYWTRKGVVILDQRLLPEKEKYILCTRAEDVAQAIETLAIRGAPAIGVAAALGIALGARAIDTRKMSIFERRFRALCRRFASTRPTARNLFWAIERMTSVFVRNRKRSIHDIQRILTGEAQSVLREDIEANRRLGTYGQTFIKNGARVLTYCNAGALATAGYGTALGVIRAAVENGKKISVIACETRPVLQGARLTAWELSRDGIPVTLITDNMAGALMRKGLIDAVIVGADRIARNGDTANKIGTYTVAVLAGENRIPFFVAAPWSTIDRSLEGGDRIIIEDRDPHEVTHISGRSISPRRVPVKNPAFDITPHPYISAIITDLGVAVPPFSRSLAQLSSPRRPRRIAAKKGR